MRNGMGWGGYQASVCDRSGGADVDGRELALQTAADGLQALIMRQGRHGVRCVLRRLPCLMCDFSQMARVFVCGNVCVWGQVIRRGGGAMLAYTF